MNTQSREKTPTASATPKTHPVEPGFLVKLTVSLLLIFGFNAVILGIMLYVLTYDPDVDSYLELVQNMAHTDQVLLRVMLISMLLQLFVVILLVGGVTLLASHQIAGPIIRYKLYIKHLSEGNFSETVTFRIHDQCGSLSTAFAEVSERLRSRLEAPRKARQILEEVQCDLCEESQEDSAEGNSAQNTVERLLEAARLLHSSGRNFSAKEMK